MTVYYSVKHCPADSTQPARVWEYRLEHVDGEQVETWHLNGEQLCRLVWAWDHPRAVYTRACLGSN